MENFTFSNRRMSEHRYTQKSPETSRLSIKKYITNLSITEIISVTWLCGNIFGWIYSCRIRAFQTHFVIPSCKTHINIYCALTFLIFQIYIERNRAVVIHFQHPGWIWKKPTVRKCKCSVQTVINKIINNNKSNTFPGICSLPARLSHDYSARTPVSHIHIVV